MPMTGPAGHAAGMAQRLRQVLVLLHLATAFGWLAAVLAVLLLAGHGELAAAARLDDLLLADLSFMTVYTGVMLAGSGPWGYTRFRWVVVKLGIVVCCALGGRAVFRRLLVEPGAGPQLVTAGALTVLAIAAVAWIGRVKPWGRLRPGAAPPPWQSPAGYLVVLITPILDYVSDVPLQAVPAAVVLARHAAGLLPR
jgi:hypothetical protein